MKNIIHIRLKKAFTLVEILVAITIFLIIMVSVFMIYASATKTAINTNVNREMQQNIKSIVETIAEDVRKNGIEGVRSSSIFPYDVGKGIHFSTSKNEYKLFGYNVNSGNKMKNATPKILLECKQLKYICFIQKESSTGMIGPLSNSRVSIIDISYSVADVANAPIKKVVISLTLRASVKNGLGSKLVKNSTLHFQTTISERYLSVK